MANHLRLALLAGISTMAFAAPAMAQTSVSSPPATLPALPTTADQPAGDPVESPEVVVTAQRREQRLQDVPISLAVVSGATLQERSVQNFEQLSRVIPTLTIVKTPAANLIVLRGIGSGPGSPSLDQSVVMFIDGIYAGNARQFASPFLDIERLEILRGPQGALVGRNTSAGAINIITRKPGDTFGGYVSSDYNFTFDGFNIEGGLDLPISSAIKLRVVGKYGDTDGYIRNTLVDQDQPTRRDIVGRATLVIDNGGPVVVTAKYEHADVKMQGVPTQLIAPAKGEFLDWTKESRLLNSPEFDNIRTNNAAVQFDIDLGGPKLVAISGYSGFKSASLIDADFFAGDFANADFDQDLDQFSQELRLISPTSTSIEYTLGAYYSASKLYEQRTTGVLFAPPASTYRQFRQEETVISTYGQLTWHMTDQISLNGSARYTHYDKSASYKRFAGATAQTNRTGALVASFSNRLKDGRIDPALSLQFELSRDAMFYASYSKGSKSAGFQGAISNATPETFAFLAERSTSYEAGMKLSFPGLGYFNVSAFHTIYRDLQVSAGIATPGALSASFFTGNAPKAKIQGIEAEFSVRPTSFLTFDGSFSWLPTARYEEFESGPCIVGKPSTGAIPGSCNQTGFRLAYAPRYAGTLNATVSAPIGSNYTVKFALSPYLQGPSFRDFSGDPVTFQKAFVKLDARIALLSGGGAWELAVVGQNLTNIKTIAYGSTAGLANTFFDPLSRTGTIDPPRSISAQARIRF